MAFGHISQREHKAIQARADGGDESAQNYLKLLQASSSILDNSNGISLARGMVGEHNDVYGQAVDDALSELVPVILDVAAGGFDSLRFYAHADQLPKEAAKNEPECTIIGTSTAMPDSEFQRKTYLMTLKDGENEIPFNLRMHADGTIVAEPRPVHETDYDDLDDGQDDYDEDAETDEYVDEYVAEEEDNNE